MLQQISTNPNIAEKKKSTAFKLHWTLYSKSVEYSHALLLFLPMLFSSFFFFDKCSEAV